MENSVLAENFMMKMENERSGVEKAVWIESFCLPFDIFKPVTNSFSPSNSRNFKFMES
jgi:hypothetical protein